MENNATLAIPASPSAALAHLAEHTSRYVEAGLSGAANTAKAYAGDLKRFGMWCAEHELDPLPTTVATLAGFMT
ncbi:MAG: integrase, partial [Hymenobacter sp.]